MTDKKRKATTSKELSESESILSTLLNNIEFRNRGPHVGDVIQRNNNNDVGTIVGYSPSQPQQRIPELFQWKKRNKSESNSNMKRQDVATMTEGDEEEDEEDEEDEVWLVAKDLKTSSSSTKKSSKASSTTEYQQQGSLLFDTIQERWDEVLEHIVITDILPQLVLLACWEEMWQDFMEKRQQQQEQQQKASADIASTPARPRPSYYTSTAVLLDPSLASSSSSSGDGTTTDATTTTNTTEPREPVPMIWCSPPQILGRIKAGCQAALDYAIQQDDYERRQQQQAAPSPVASTSNYPRRSTRAPTFSSTTTVQKPPTLPNLLAKGGRIANWLLDERNWNKFKTEEEDPDQQEDENGGAVPMEVDGQQEEKDEKQMGDSKPPAVSSNNNDNDDEPTSPSSEQQPAAQATEEKQEGEQQQPASEPSSSDSKPPAKSSPSNKNNNDDDDSLVNAHEMPLTDEDKDDDDDDDDFDAADASDDGDDVPLENVRRESKNVLVLSGQEDNDNMDEDDDDESDEESIDSHDAVAYELLDNPYLQPTVFQLLDWMGRRYSKKIFTPPYIQTAIIVGLKKKATRPILDRFLDLDELVLTSSDSTSTTTSLTLEGMVGAGGWKEYQAMDVTVFGRNAKVRLVSNSEAHQELVQQQQRKDSYNKQKSWNLWRFKSIHSSYTIWPSWQASIEARVEELFPKKNQSTPATAEQQQQQQQQQEAPTAPTTEDDHAMAERLANEQQQDTTTTATRRSRRAKSNAEQGGAVFYGGQSQLSHKQLLVTILKMVRSSKHYTTIPSLQTLLLGAEAETPTNLHRMRVALGKLLYKRREVSKIQVTSLWSDEPLFKSIMVVRSTSHDDDQQQQQQQQQQQPLVSTLDDSVLEQDERLKFLIAYIEHMHRTELQLRYLIMNALTKTSIPTLAMAADERIGSKEAADRAFVDDESKVEWVTSSTSSEKNEEHAQLVGKQIFRPAVVGQTSNLTSSFSSDDASSPECRWYQIQDFCESVPSSEEGSDAVERRAYFRGIPITPEGQPDAGLPALLLTEGQVYAGLKAADMKKGQDDDESSCGDSTMKAHPFAGGAGTKVILRSCDDEDTVLHCIVAAHDTIVTTTVSSSSSDGENNNNDDEQQQQQQHSHQILLFPEDSDPDAVGFWATVTIDAETGSLGCMINNDDEGVMYRVDQSDYDVGTSAFEACRGIVEWLRRNPKAEIFLNPVDPVALGIPDYFDVIKHPMDISTLSGNLESGMYSKIAPGKTMGRSATERMLNGPFRDDAIRIFDNAIQFNPPNDWIHKTAVNLKKNLLKKLEQASEMDDSATTTTGRRGASAAAASSSRQVYLEYDSDEFYYEDNNDDEDYMQVSNNNNKKRRRQRAPREDFATKAMEHPIRLQSTLNDVNGLRGPFAQLPISSDASCFSLGSEWGCRRESKSTIDDNGTTTTMSSPSLPTSNSKMAPDEKRRYEELDALLAQLRQVEDRSLMGVRRSTRTVQPHIPYTSSQPNSKASSLSSSTKIEYMAPGPVEELTASNRQEVESMLEALHEEYYAVVFQQSWRALHPVSSHAINANVKLGLYKDGFFPPYLGRVVPCTLSSSSTASSGGAASLTWEIRSPYIVPAVRWVLRGLTHSGHLSVVEPMTYENPMLSGILMTNDLFYVDPTLRPFEVLEEPKKAARQKYEESISSEEEKVEMSEYEKARAERVARNQERLKALGLA